MAPKLSANPVCVDVELTDRGFGFTECEPELSGVVSGYAHQAVTKPIA